MTSLSASAPSQVRYWVVFACAAVAVVLYLDRVCLALLGTYVRQDLHLTSEQFDYVLSAFFLAYALGQVPAGTLSDRWGARRMMTLYLIACGLCMIGIALAESLLWLIVFRLALGLAEAGGYPTASGVIRRWVPVYERGRANSFVTLGGRIGGASTQVLTAFLVVTLVPLSVASTLQSTDLIDTAALRTQLRQVAALDSLAAKLQMRLNLDADDAILLEQLNQAIADPELTVGVSLDRGKLSREGQTILDLPPSERSVAQTQRLNRLALEIEFPKAIRQIYGTGWRGVMLVYALVGLAVAGLFWGIVRDRPEEHPWCNDAERQRINFGVLASAPASQESSAVSSTGASADASEKSSAVQQGKSKTESIGYLLKILATNRNLLLSSIGQFCINFGWAFLITKLPQFLEEVYRTPVEQRGQMSMAPLLFGAMGMLVGGRFADYLLRTVSPRWLRAIPMGVIPLIGLLAFVVCPHLPTAWEAVAALAVVAFATDMMVPSTWALMQDMTRRRVGAAIGWANMWGNFGAALSPIALGQLQGAFGWDAVFYVCALAYLGASLTGLLIDASIPLETEATESSGRSTAG